MRKLLCTIATFAVLISPITPANASTLSWSSNALTNLNPDGALIQGRFNSFPSNAGIYILQCLSPLRAGERPGDCLNLVWVTTSGGIGRQSSKDLISFTLKSSYTAGSKNIDCAKDQCVLFFRYDHTAALDKSEDVEMPITFATKSSASSSGGSVQNTAGADFRDPFFPIITDLKIGPSINSEINQTGKINYKLALRISLTVKVRKNGLAGLALSYKGPNSTQENLCQSLTGRHAIGFTDPQELGKKVILPLEGLIEKKADGDWTLESYSLLIPIAGNTELFPCQLGSGNTLQSLELIDLAGKWKTLNQRQDGIPIINTDTQPDAITFRQAVGVVSASELPEYLICGSIKGGTWSGAALKCLDKVNRENSLIVIWRADKAAADKAAADKAAADKAAADKAAADKAAADKAAADKAAADKAAASKKVTITCIKGKVLKKVTSPKPKCPAGYKKK